MRARPFPSPWWVLGITAIAGWWFKAHCGAAWSGSIQYLTGCYSDAVPFWGLRGVAAGQLPYLEARIEYPVLTGALIWLEGLVVRHIGGARADAADFLLMVTAVNAALAFLVLWMMERAGVPRARLYAWAAAPALILYLGHNWDMLAVAFAVAALLAARRDVPAHAAALAALGTAAKLFPLLLMPLLLLQALLGRAGNWRTRIASAASLALVAIVFWGAVNLPVALRAFPNWSEFYTFSQARSGTAASVWEIMATQHWWSSDIPTRNLFSSLAFITGAGAIVAFGWRQHAGRLWLLFTPVLAWFLLTNKVFSPQFDLWLYPFVLLTGRKLWPAMWFAIGDVLAYFAEFWWFATLDGAGFGITPGHIAVAAAVRAAAMLWIIADAVRSPAPAWLTPSAARAPR